jgi:hypothetical protein
MSNSSALASAAWSSGGTVGARENDTVRSPTVRTAESASIVTSAETP